MNWVGLDGWPCSFEESFVGTRLIAALQSLEGAASIPQDRVISLAELLWMTADFAGQEERPNSLVASFSASEAELRKLADLATKLQLHISKMHLPAVEGVRAEGFNLDGLSRQLEEAQVAARYAFNVLSAPERVAGARPKVAAEEVGLQAGLLYQHITGRRPTYTSNPDTSVVSGPWVNFLEDVYAALGIDASAGAQAKTLSKKLATNLDS